jgi:hypothetical protein
MTVTQLCVDDVLLASRKGALSLEEEARLNAHLARCARCRIALEAGRAFDELQVARVGDDELAMRIAARATPRRPKRGLAMVAAVAVLMSGSITGAAAAQGGFSQLVQQARELLSLESSPHPMAPLTPKPRVSHLPAPAPGAEAVDSPPSEPPVELEAQQPLGAPGVDPPLPPRATDATVGEMFSRANLARREGRTNEAARLYHAIRSSFPNSVEAKVSLVSLGRLELGSDPALALRYFTLYLAQSSHTTLVEEALFGQARALGQLGRTAEERAAWTTLIALFPASVYAERAKSRLAQAGLAQDNDGPSQPGATHPRKAAEPAP